MFLSILFLTYLQGQDIHAVLLGLVVELQEVVAHAHEAEVVVPGGVRLSIRLGQGQGKEIVGASHGANLNKSLMVLRMSVSSKTPT